MANRGVNKVIIVGRLGDNPETKCMPSGGAVTVVSVATSEDWKDKQSGEKQERTEWHRVVFYNKLAEIAGEYLTKGAQVYVEGKLRTRKWDKNGVDHYITEIIAEEMQMLGNKPEGAPANKPAAAGKQSQKPAATPAPAPADPFDDDVPF